MDELTREQEEAVAATVGAIQRIAMAIVELPTEGRAAHYAMVRRKFEAVMMEVGIEGATAHAWLNSTMDGIESLVSEIEAGGGAVGWEGLGQAMTNRQSDAYASTKRLASCLLMALSCFGRNDNEIVAT